MTRSARRLLAAGLSLSLAFALGGCVSLLPKSEPAQLYSFVDAVEARATPPSGPVSAVVLGALTFPRAATSDALLTRTGAEAAYIAEARWSAPAQVLFREAVERAFDRSGRVRILTRGEVGQAAGILRIEVRSFEVRYPAPEAIPSAVVLVHARLNGIDGAFIDARDFEAETQAGENRVGPIVEAYRASTAKALGELTAWLETSAPPPSATRPAATSTTTTQSTSTTTTTVRP